LQTKYYDIIVIGGGIHGVGVAQAAAARGYSTLVLEKTHLASGTSSRSSKLIHGGLRYLESAQLFLVRESIHERALLLKLAPELVKLRPFIIPIFNTSKRRPWQIRAGLSLYALIGGLRPSHRFSIIPRNLWHTLDGLRTDNLQAVFKYYDAQTDDAALTRAVMKSAMDLGAELSMQANFVSGDLRETGCVIHYKKNNKSFLCETSVLINAAGPWVNDVLDKISPSIDKIKIDLVQGSHILLKGRLIQGIYYIESPRDKRPVFVMPWQNKILVGTTERNYLGNPAWVKTLDEEKHYLLETLANYFPGYNTRDKRNIVSSFAGLRVLPAVSEKFSKRSRETIFHTDRRIKPRVLSIYGGKLTTYRAVAEKVMRRLDGGLPDRTPIAKTDKLKLKPD